MNIVRSFKKDSFKDFVSYIRTGDIEKVKSSFKPEYINKRILNEPNGIRPIHAACENDYVEIVKFLIDRGCDFEQRTNDNLLPIHIAAQFGCVGVVDLFLKRKNQLEMETKDKFRPVHFACQYGRTDVLLLLINNKCNITCLTSTGYSPLHLACEAGMVDIVRILLTYNCPIDIVTKNGFRPIDLAKNHKEIVALLSNENCVFDLKETNNSVIIDVDVENLDNYGYQLFNCIRENNISFFMNIFDSQKPILNDTESELTLMEFAISGKAYEFVEIILGNNLNNKKFEKYLIHFKEKNADIFDRILVEYTIYRAIRFNLKTDLKSISVINQNCILTGTSFLELAVKYNSFEYTSLILVKLVQKNEALWNKVKKMAQDNLNYEIFKLIAEREKYLETRYEALWTRMHIAVNDDDIEMVKYLMNTSHEASVDTMPSVGSPLNLAAITGRIECFKILLGKYSKEKNSFHIAIKNGMSRYCIDIMQNLEDINEMDEEGNTLLHLSAKFLSYKLCNVLFEFNADPNIINCNGNTPLHEMVLFNWSRMPQMENDICSITKLLLDHHTDINIANNDGHSIFQDCLEFRNINFIHLISHDRTNIVLTKKDLKIIMDNNWIDILEIVLPNCLKANEFIDKEMLTYFLKNRTTESFNSLWFLSDPDTKFQCTVPLLYQCALNNNKELFTMLCEEETCELTLLENGETILTSLLKMHKQDFCSLLIESNLSTMLVNQINSVKETALHIAARNEFYGLLENMLYIADDINKEDCQGNTPFLILINNMNISDEIERLSKLIISKSLLSNQENLSLMRSIENCRHQDLKSKLSKLYKIELERKPKNEENKNLCSVCLDNVVNISFDCGHTSCRNCSIRLKTCHICRSVIRSKNDLFL